MTDRTEHITTMIHQLSISVSPEHIIALTDCTEHITTMIHQLSISVSPRDTLTDRTEHITAMIHQLSISVSPHTLTDHTEHITTMIHQLSISVSPRTHWQIVQSILPQWFIRSVFSVSPRTAHCTEHSTTMILRVHSSRNRSYRAYYRNDSSAQY